MLRLRTLLLRNYLFYIILTISIVLTIIRLNTNNSSNYSINDKSITGVIDKYFIKDNKLSIDIKCSNEIIKGSYYFKDKRNIRLFKNSFSLGDKVSVNGTLSIPSKNNTLNTFSYYDYLLYKQIYFLIKIDNIEKISDSNSIYYNFKNSIINQINKSKKSSSYLRTFILGDNSLIDSDVKYSYQNNGISHLFAISGMHISLISLILLKTLSRFSIKEEKRYLIVIIFLCIYLSLTFSASVLRATLFFLLFAVNKIFYFYIKPFNIFILTLSISLIINPFFIYMIGFKYSFLISGTLILTGEYINRSNSYIIKLLKTSLISFIVSSIISLNNFYSLNFLSIIYNIFYVPFISTIVFPLSFLTFLFPLLDSILYFLINILEITSIYLSHINIFNIVFMKLGFFNYIIYSISIFFFIRGLIYKKYKYLIILILVFIVHFFIPIFSKENYFLMFDIGQGDSLLLKSHTSTTLIDTGGIMSFSGKSNSSLVRNITIPYLKSMGIRKLDNVILTHGDYDHLGEVFSLIDNFRIDNIYINNNKLNKIERSLSDKRVVKKLGADQIIENGKMSLYSLNDDLDDENDSSIILLGSINSYRFLLMGDASVRSEKEIMKYYDIGSIDFLKVGHHGSRTSTSKSFLEEVNPKYAFISAGVDNKFNHPHKIVLDRLDDFKIKHYETNKLGSIKFDFNSGVISTYK